MNDIYLPEEQQTPPAKRRLPKLGKMEKKAGSWQEPRLWRYWPRRCCPAS